MLCCYVSTDHRDWDVTLPYVTFAYNSSRHDKAGFLPFYLLYGRESTLPLDTLMPMSAEQPSVRSQYAWEAIARADHARHIARNRLCSSQPDQKTIYDRRHRVAHFAPGSLFSSGILPAVSPFKKSFCPATVVPFASCAKLPP